MGVNCTDNVAQNVSYAAIMDMIYTKKVNGSVIKYDDTMKSPFVNVYDNDGKTTISQIWYDDPQSLAYKYVCAKGAGLRGVGPSSFGDLVYDGSSAEKERAKEMWSTFDAFFGNDSKYDDYVIPFDIGYML